MIRAALVVLGTSLLALCVWGYWSALNAGIIVR